MKNISKLLMAVALVVAINFTANAQPGSTTGGFDDEPVDVPLDGGICLLAIAGSVYGVKKINQKKNIINIYKI